MPSQIINRPSPYGPESQVPTRIVVHAMCYQLDYEGRRMYAASFLERVKLSAHVLVTPNGVRVRCREDTQGAWHARGYNQNSLGIEVLVPGVFDLVGLKRVTAEPWVGRAQFDAVVEQVSEWKRSHRIERIDRHSDLDPARRWFDPGEGFPWAELLKATWRCT